MYHVYTDRWINKNETSKKFEHDGILINDTLYDAGYVLVSDDDEFGLSYGKLEEEGTRFRNLVRIAVTESIIKKAKHLAADALEFARNDLYRVMEDEKAKGNDYTYMDYDLHNPRASKSILENLIYKSSDSYYSFGKAYKAFCNGGFNNELDTSAIIKVTLTDRDTLRYLASENRIEVLNELVEININTANEELIKEKNYIVDKLATMLIAEEFYKELAANTSGGHYLIRDIYNKVHCESLANAKTVNVTAEIEGKTFTFNIERSYFRHEDSISEYGIMPATVRNEIGQQLKKRRERSGWGKDKIFLEDILEITYKKKLIYKKG